MHYSRRSALRFLGTVGAIVLIGGAAYLSTRPLGTTAPGLGAAGATFYPIGSPVEGVGIGQSAPDFVADGDHRPLLTDLDGDPIRLADFAGRPLWIVFWATWCTPCQQEASHIRAAYHAHAGAQLAVLAIDIQEPAAAVREYVQSHELDYAIGLDPTAAVKGLYGAWGLPSHYFVDADGMIRDRYFGQMTSGLVEEHLKTIIGP